MIGKENNPIFLWDTPIQYPSKKLFFLPMSSFPGDSLSRILIIDGCIIPSNFRGNLYGRNRGNQKLFQ